MRCHPITNATFPIPYKVRNVKEEPVEEKTEFRGTSIMPQGDGILFMGHVPAECYANYMQRTVITSNPDFPQTIEVE